MERRAVPRNRLVTRVRGCMGLVEYCCVRVGVISDTHGLLRPEAVAALRGVDMIIHAGDIGSAAILVELGAIAPVVAVRGNNDRDAWAASIPEIATSEIAGSRLYVIHDL